MSGTYPPPSPYGEGGQRAPAGEYPGSIQGPPVMRRILPRTGKPVATYSIMGLTILVYLAQIFSQQLLGFDLPAAFGLKNNQAILQGQLWRLFTPMLLHGSLLHIGFNMYALYALGPTLESYYKRVRYLALYLLAGFAGNVTSFIFSPANSLGSSTAIFGLIGAYGVFLYQNRQLLGDRGRRGLINIVTIAIINLLIGTMPGIDNWGHIGGLFGGTLFAWIGGPKIRVEWGIGDVRLEDERQPGDALKAGLAVVLVFGAMLAAALLMH